MREPENRDRDLSRFDPLDLGWGDDEVERLPKRGRPRSPILNRARAAYWAWTTKIAAGMSFAEIERELAPRPFPRRDGGGFEQPNAWLKYAKGNRCPLPPNEGKMSPVVRAERRYSGTQAIYESIVWDLMYDDHSRPAKRMKLTARISPQVLRLIEPQHIEKKDQYRVLLTPDGIARLVLVRHLDALGLLLMQWRNLDWERADISLIFFVRKWLLFSFQWMEPFAACRCLMAKLIHHNVMEIGLLNGPGGLDPAKSLEQCVRDAYLAALMGGVKVNLTSELPHLT